MSNEVFGVNVVEVEKQVRKLVEVYKTSGKKATLEEWGHKLNESFNGYGHNDLIAKFLKVLFEAKNDEFINRVFEEKEPVAWLKCEFIKECPHLRKTKRLGYMVELAETWAVYNLPILQQVMDVLINHMEETSDYLDSCFAFEDYIDAIRDTDGFNEVPFFQSYISKYIVEYLKNVNIEDLVFYDDKGETVEVDMDCLEYVWGQFCDMELCEDVLLAWYCSFMVDAVREVLNRANV